MDLIILLPILVSFFITLFLMSFWIRKANQIGLMWDDMNKIKAKKVAGSGGLIVVLGFIIGVLLFIAYRVFILNETSNLIEIFSLLTVILLVSGIGLMDDLFGWQHGGLGARSRIILVLLAAIPLMAINAGRSVIQIPSLGSVDFGIFYPLIIIPLGIIGATTTFNFLAGFNGLEAGQGILLLSAVGLVAFFTGNSWLFLIALCMIVSLIAFLIFNFYPARVFPGDILTYSVGALIAIIAILGNFEKVAVFFFIPVIIEIILKARGNLKKQSFGLPDKEGFLGLRYNKIYGLTHLSIYLLNKWGIKVTEKKVVYLIWTFQFLVIMLGLIIFRNGIFI